MNELKILICIITYTKSVQQGNKFKNEKPKRRKIVTHFVLNASLIWGIYSSVLTLQPFSLSHFSQRLMTFAESKIFLSIFNGESESEDCFIILTYKKMKSVSELL